MDDNKTCEILGKLVKEYPKPLDLKDFSIPANEKQKFLNFLMVLEQKRFIEGLIEKSMESKTAGLPINALNILIRLEGRSYYEQHC